MAGVNSRFAQVSVAEILQIQDEAVPEKVREDFKVLKSVSGFISLSGIHNSSHQKFVTI